MSGLSANWLAEYLLLERWKVVVLLGYRAWGEAEFYWKALSLKVDLSANS